MAAPRSIAFPLVLTLVAAAPAVSQTEVLEPVEQMIDDISELGFSLRQVERDLRQPSDFGKVYRLPGRDDEFMRIQGAVFAVFPRSVYAYNKKSKKIWPVIAFGTEFYIGPPPDVVEAMAVPSPTDHPDRIRHRIELRVEPDLATLDRADVRIRPGEPREHALVTTTPALYRRPVEASSVDLRLVDDPGYRTTRLNELLARAAKASCQK